MSVSTRRGAALLAAGMVAAAPPAAALWDDKLEMFASSTVARDDNVFRLSTGADTAAILGQTSRADTFMTNSAGFNLNLPWGRQRFRAGVTVNDTRYDTFSVLNLTGHAARAAWLWQVGNDLSGEIGYIDARALASLANVQGGVQSAVPNVLESRRLYLNAAYLVTPSWRLNGEMSRLDHENSTAFRQINDISQDTAGATVSYISRAGNELGLQLKTDRGDLQQQQVVGGVSFNNDFRQNTVALVGLWKVSGSSRFTGRLGSVKRDYEQLTQRDYSGTVARVGWEWEPTAKLALQSAIYNEISGVEEINVGFVVARGVMFRPVYKPTEKLELAGHLDFSRREIRGEVERAIGLLPERRDRVAFAGLSLLYRTTAWLQLGMSLRHEQRTSTEAFGDYRSNAAALSARVSF